MDIQEIKELALANGFKLKEQASGNMDLNAYVYDFANAIEQAAKAQAVPDQVLDAPACVGGGTFQKGVKWSTVIGAAQRHYENDGHHEAPAICIRDQLRVASGHSVVVPKEPTYEMLEAGSEARSRTEGHISSIWEAMIAAQEPAND